MFQKVFSLIFIFVCSYGRQTYFLNLDLKNAIISKSEVGVSPSVVFQSILIFAILFGLANLWIAVAFNRKNWKVWMIVYAVLFVVSGVFIGLDYFFKSNLLFSIGAIIKNFLLSPIYPLVLFAILYQIEQKKTST